MSEISSVNQKWKERSKTLKLNFHVEDFSSGYREKKHTDRKNRRNKLPIETDSMTNDGNKDICAF